MNFVSVTFLVFFLIVVFVYYVLPDKFRWIVLLSASIVFYLAAGLEKLIFVAITADIAFVSTNRIAMIYDFSEMDDVAKKRKAKRILSISILGILLQIIYVKTGREIADILNGMAEGNTINIIVPLGISYYTFSVIGYMCDVYWKKEKAETNLLKFLLFMIYFPSILQGPIMRHKKFSSQIEERKQFSHQAVSFGLQRMLWGYFKKMVIADRFGIYVNEIFGRYLFYEGQYFVVAIVASAIQLYCDFSGCMDIAIGASECFGIHLDENFIRPFGAKSAAEFWRRWHITLGTWFKDYVYMPLVINPKLISVSKKVKEKFGARVGKSVMSVVPLAVVWFLTGLWHGTGTDYILWGLYWGIIIIGSTIFAPELKKITKRLHIDIKSNGWGLFQQIRTILIFLGGRLLTAPGNLKVSGYALKSLLTNFNVWIYFDGSLEKLGLDRKDMHVGIIGVLILAYISHKQEQGVKIRERIAGYPLVVRWIIYYSLMAAILLFGMYGAKSAGGTFIYMQY